MGRSTVYNKGLTSPEKIALINKENITLVNDFLEYLESTGRSQTTIKNYRADLTIFFCWVLDEVDNKSFINITKREIARFQNKALKEWGWSTTRLRTVKAAMSSLGNYIENILDDDYVGYRSIVRKVESPPKQEVREKTTWTDEEVEDLLAKLLKKSDYEKACFIALAVYGGRRKAEICRFKVSDFDDSHLVCGGSLYKSSPIKTKGRAGGKYLNCYTLAKKFKPYFDLWMDERERRGVVSEWLFPSREDPNKELSLSTISGWIDGLCSLTGKEVYYHSFRHYYTSMLSNQGLPDEVIKQIQGWSDVSMVSVYVDRDMEDTLDMYFDADGIKTVQQKQLNEL